MFDEEAIMTTATNTMLQWKDTSAKHDSKFETLRADACPNNLHILTHICCHLTRSIACNHVSMEYKPNLYLLSFAERWPNSWKLHHWAGGKCNDETSLMHGWTDEDALKHKLHCTDDQHALCYHESENERDQSSCVAYPSANEVLITFSNLTKILGIAKMWR